LEHVWLRRVLAVGSALVALVGVTTAVLTFFDIGGDGSTPPVATTPPPASPPVPPPMSGGGSLFERVDRVLATLPTASVAFNAPEKLTEGESAEIELLLSLQDSIDRLKEQISEVGEREGERVRITDEMEATLTGVDFKIEAVTPQRQAVSRRDVTRWKWEIEPTQTGVLRLHLTLTGFVEVAGERRARAIRTFEYTLVVRVTWRDKVASFVEDNWQWLWTAILAPVAFWAIRRRRSARDHRSGRRGTPGARVARPSRRDRGTRRTRSRRRPRSPPQ
jgi:hypothetical protein